MPITNDEQFRAEIDRRLDPDKQPREECAFRNYKFCNDCGACEEKCSK
jgi:Pyruvate/2-oxoacid:ferredoxin oxidoreductase delta subunit